MPITFTVHRPLPSIKEVRRVADDVGMDVTGQVAELEERAKQLRKDTYSRLTPVQRLAVARHPNRPTFLDIALNITDKFVELHGDRCVVAITRVVCASARIIPTVLISQRPRQQCRPGRPSHCVRHRHH